MEVAYHDLKENDRARDTLPTNSRNEIDQRLFDDLIMEK